LVESNKVINENIDVLHRLHRCWKIWVSFDVKGGSAGCTISIIIPGDGNIAKDKSSATMSYLASSSIVAAKLSSRCGGRHSTGALRFLLAISAAASVAAVNTGGEFIQPMGSNNNNAQITYLQIYSICVNMPKRVLDRPPSGRKTNPTSFKMTLIAKIIQ